MAINPEAFDSDLDEQDLYRGTERPSCFLCGEPTEGEDVCEPCHEHGEARDLWPCDLTCDEDLWS